jgi:autotransporter-associated beta strand protein
MTVWGRCRGILLLAGSLVITAVSWQEPARAQSGTWQSSGVTSWNNTARWRNGTVAGGTNSTATFTASGTASLLSNIVLGNLTTGASRVQIRSGTETVNANLTNQQIQFVTTTGTAPAITNAGRLDMFAVIAGSQGFTKSGAGQLYLNRTNTYTGTTTISTGDVRLSVNDGLGASGTGNETVIASGAMLRLDNAATASFVSGIQTSESFTISGDGVGGLGALRSQAGTDNAFTGPITLAANASIKANTGVSLTLGGSINVGSNTLTLSDNGDFTVSGGFAGTGNVSYSSQGSLILSGSSTLTGTTTVTNSGSSVTMTGYMAGPMAFNGSSRSLIGTGTFAGGLSVGSSNVLSPGASGTAAADSYGTITASTLEVQSATVRMGIQTASIYDQLVMTAGSGGLTLGGNATLAHDFSGVLADLPSGSWNLMSFNGLLGNWNGVESTGYYAGAWTGPTSNVWTLATVGSGSTQTLTFNQATGVLAVVPEPSTIALFCGVAAAASLIRLRRRASSRDLAVYPRSR